MITLVVLLCKYNVIILKNKEIFDVFIKSVPVGDVHATPSSCFSGRWVSPACYAASIDAGRRTLPVSRSCIRAVFKSYFLFFTFVEKQSKYSS